LSFSSESRTSPNWAAWARFRFALRSGFGYTDAWLPRPQPRPATLPACWMPDGSPKRLQISERTRFIDMWPNPDATQAGAGADPVTIADMRLKPTSKSRRGRKCRASAQHLREVRRLEQADRRWNAAMRAGLREFDKQYKGDSENLWWARLAEAGAFIPPKPPGYDLRRRQCVRCGTRAVYNPEFDSNFCPRCDRWLESRPGDDSPFPGRPRRPLPRRSRAGTVSKTGPKPDS
jgi:hypothetical protein